MSYWVKGTPGNGGYTQPHVPQRDANRYWRTSVPR
jgi:hypothetical protein